MNITELKKLGTWLAARDLTDKTVGDYSRADISDMVEFIIEAFGHNRPCPVMTDHANRLIVPANADHGQLRAAIKMIEAMLKWSPPENTISQAKADAPHVWDTYQQGI